MPFADLPTGARLHYIDTDENADPNKPVAMLIHGMLGTGEKDLGNVIEWLRPAYRVIAPTMRGYGESQPKPRDFPPQFYQRDAADVLALIDVLDLKDVNVLGYSDGGEIALIIAGLTPEKFRSVAVWGAVGYFGPAMRPAAQRLFPGSWITDEEVALHHIADRDAFALSWIQAVKGMVDAGGDVSLSLAPKITAPVLLMLGDQDTLNPEDYGRNFIERTPNGRLRMFHCGHGVHEQAWDEFQQVVGDFLRTAGT
jgi:valacyclovir hydrolase